MTQELIEQIYGGEQTAEATKLLKYIYAGAQPIEDNDFAMMFGRMNLAKFVEVKAKEDEIIAKQGKKLKEEYNKTNSRLGTELQEARKYIKDMEQEIDELRAHAKQQADALDKIKLSRDYYRSKVDEFQAELKKKNDEIAIKDSAINDLKAERDKLSDRIATYKGDNFDLQADVYRLRHQLEAIKNVIAL